MTLLSTLKRQFDHFKKNTAHKSDGDDDFEKYSFADASADEAEDSLDNEMLRPTYQYSQTVVKFSQASSEINNAVAETSPPPAPQSNTTDYSHGLEKIYSLENVDPKSIKPLTETKTEYSAQSINWEDHFDSADDQLHFDFDGSCKNWLLPFVYGEPIQVLALSSHTEKCLCENQILTLESLIGVDLRKFVFLKGFGQGHIDEIKQKLDHYLQGRPLKRTRNIDFASWLRTLIGAFDRKKTYLCLQEIGLQELVTLSPPEAAELKRISDEKRQEWIKEALTACAAHSSHEQIHTKMTECVDILIKPWIILRHGICLDYELEERLQQISSAPELSEAVLQFFKSILNDSNFGAHNSLIAVDPKVYCCNEFYAQQYQFVVGTALTYFYKPQIIYPLDQLCQWLQKEFVSQWLDIADEFIIKALRASPRLIVFRGQCGNLFVRA